MDDLVGEWTVPISVRYPLGALARPGYSSIDGRY